MNGTFRVQAPGERDKVDGSHGQGTYGLLRVGEYALAKAEVFDAAGEVGIELCRSDRRFEQAGSCLYGERRVVLDCIERGETQLPFG